MSRSVGLVIPALNPAIPRLNRYLDELRETVDPDAIRIELDDPTGEHAGLADQLGTDVAIATERRGKGLAITAGFEALETDILAFVDADGSTAPSSVASLLAPLAADEADLAVASRHRPESVVIGRSSTRRTMSRSFARFAGLATGLGLSDFQCGAKAITAEAWDDISGRLHETGFGWDLELLWLADARGHRITEVPVEWTERPGSTVPPLQTAGGLSLLAARIAAARLRGRTRLASTRPTLLDRLEASTPR